MKQRDDVRKRGFVLGAMIAGALFWQAAGAQQPAQPARVPGAMTEQENPLKDAEIAEFARAVQSQEFRERDGATSAALQDERFTLGLLERMLREQGAGMTAEGRERVAAVARDRFARSARGAMGISFGGQQLGLADRVIVGQTYEGFESFVLLQPGDIIIEADGQELKGPDAQARMMAIIVSHDPGDLVPLTVRRGAQKERVDVRLRSFNDLPNTMMDAERLTRAWRYRSQGLLPAGGEAIGVNVARENWDRTRRVQINALRQTRRTQLKDQTRLPEIAGGGMARVAYFDSEDLGTTRFVFVEGARRPVQIAGNVFFGGDDARPPMTIAEEMRGVALARQRERAQIGLDQDSRKRLAMLDKIESALRAEIEERGESEPDIGVDVDGPEERRH